MLMPPSGGRLGSASVMPGYFAAAICLNTAGALVFGDGETNGEVFMKLEEPDSKPRRAVSSVEVSMFGAATGELAIAPIAESACSVRPLASAILSGPDRIDVPADVIIALVHTTRPSYLLAWTWICPL